MKHLIYIPFFSVFFSALLGMEKPASIPKPKLGQARQQALDETEARPMRPSEIVAMNAASGLSTLQHVPTNDESEAAPEAVALNAALGPLDKDNPLQRAPADADWAKMREIALRGHRSVAKYERINEPQATSESVVDKIRRGSVLMERTPITAEHCTQLEEEVSISAAKEKARGKVNVRVLLKGTLDQTKLSREKEPDLRMQGTTSVLALLPKRTTKPQSKSEIIARVCHLVQEDQIEKLKSLDSLPADVKDDIKNMHDEKGRPLLFVAIRNDSLGMVMLLVDTFHVSVNELFEEKPALEYVRELKRDYKIEIEKFLIGCGAQTYLGIYSELLPDRLHPTVATKLLKYLKANESSKFRKLATIVWPKSAQQVKEGLSKITDANGYSLLFLAAAADSPDIVMALVEYGIFVNEVCNDLTVLDYVLMVRNRHTELIRIYLQEHGALSLKDLVDHDKFRSAPVTIPRPREWHDEALVNIVRHRKSLVTSTIEELVKNDLETGGFLIKAAQEGRLELVARLVEKSDAPINFLHEGKTPLDHARAKGHTSVVEYLLKKRAKSAEDEIETVMNNFRVEDLISNFQNESKDRKQAERKKYTDIREWARTLCSTSGSLALLFLSASVGKISLIKGPHSKISLNMFNKEQGTPFDAAIRFQQYLAAYTLQKLGGKRSFQVDALEKLIQEEQDYSPYLNNLAIYEAVLADDLATITTSVSAHTDVNNLLVLACHCNKPRIMRFLVEQHHADVNYVHNNGETVLDTAYANPEIITYLKGKGAHIKEQYVAI